MMLYRIGLATGEWNIEQPGGLAEKMYDYQLFRWEEFYNLEPFGSAHEEVLHALGYYRITNAIRIFQAGFTGDKNFKPTELKDFMPSLLNQKANNKPARIEDAVEQFQYEKDILKRCGKVVPGK